MIDSELRKQHAVEVSRKTAVALVPTHVDGLKLSGITEEIIVVLQHIEHIVFGRMTVYCYNFTNCRVRRRQDAKANAATLD